MTTRNLNDLVIHAGAPPQSAEHRAARDQRKPPTPVAACPPVCVDPPGRIGIELPSGVRLSVDAAVDADALSRVLGVLGR